MRGLLALFCVFAQARAWDNAELDLFDLVEEVQSLHQQTLYEYLGLDNSCTSADVRRSYKKLALSFTRTRTTPRMLRCSSAGWPLSMRC